LLEAAREAALSAYAPYSRFRVGAALLADGAVFRGCNVENASYGLAMCAERNAVFAAAAAGHRRIACIAVACVDAPVDAAGAALMPCGACLQVIAEFAGPATPVLVDRAGAFTLGELLPRAFRLDESGQTAEA
jgi:cytidine deaminase